MALDSKKLAADVASFKKAVRESDRQIAEIAKAYKDVMAEDDGMGAAVKALVRDIALASEMIKTNVASLKALADAAKKVTGDVEMILRRFEDANTAYQDMGNTLFELDKQLKKDKGNKDLIKKYEIAEKALERQSAAMGKIADEAGTIRATISSFDNDLQGNKAWNLSAIAEIARNMKELTEIIDKKKRFLREIEKSGGRW
jgi:chromosome segregation ATPase